MRPRIGVIVDNRRLAIWQAEALRRVAGKYDLLLYNCTNSRPPPRRARHALYYALNLFTIRNSLTRLVPVPSDLPVAGETAFQCDYQSRWQVLPKPLLEKLAEDRPAVLVKFGMGLLRIPGPGQLRAPILSYHHGDPRAFRGRPAGFHEIAEGADRLGQVVQVLTNDLDAGAVAASAETRLFSHSYRATLVEAYRVSPLLLERAIATALAGRTAAQAKGPVYRLPSNSKVAAFCMKLLWNSAKRLAYGALMEKGWQAAQADVAAIDPPNVLRNFPTPERWTVEPTPSGYSFIADPFFHPSCEGILVEGLSKSSRLGEILHLANGKARRLTETAVHWSYPATISSEGEYFVLPEIAESHSVQLFRLTAEALEPVSGFVVDGDPHLIDPTLLRHEDRFYLFANRLEETPLVLRLWTSERLTGPFVEHPASPVRISPAGSRMAGKILVTADSSLWRFGQDSTGNYGDGVLLFEIDRLSANEYQETERARLRFSEAHGPHTVNFDRSHVLFDFYSNRLSPFAGLRRLGRLLEFRSRRGGN
jgi:hypothetical protein